MYTIESANDSFLTASDNPDVILGRNQSSQSIFNRQHLAVQDMISGSRPTLLNNTSRLNTSVIFQDTQREGRPSIYLFIFVNPLSGDRKGEDLIKLPIQHFRLRRFPQVQVEIHNILDKEDRDLGIENIQLVESMAKLNQLPSLESSDGKPKISDAVTTRHIHVWSAGGDGTVMSVFEMLVEHRIDLDTLFFSCKHIC